MVAGIERRVFPRSELPILIHIPRICPENPLRPKDISMGGFMVELEKEPDVGAVSPCGVRIEDTLFSGEATLEIYNLSGELVRTVAKDNLVDAFVVWDVMTERGLPPASGLYIYRIIVPGVGTRVGKLALFTEEERLEQF